MAVKSKAANLLRTQVPHPNIAKKL